MLVFARKIGQSFMIGDNIEILLIDVRGDQVRLGIDAPKSIAVNRKEIWLQIQANKKEKTESGEKVKIFFRLSEKEIYQVGHLFGEKNIEPEIEITKIDGQPPVEKPVIAEIVVGIEDAQTIIEIMELVGGKQMKVENRNDALKLMIELERLRNLSISQVPQQIKSP